MNKDFWERIGRLDELAGNAMQGEWVYEPENENIRHNGVRIGVIIPELGDYIAAAKPAMIMEMIDELKRLEKEADCLATFLADICDYVADVDCCPVAEASVCPSNKCKDANKPEIWGEEARELVELRTEADNA